MSEENVGNQTTESTAGESDSFDWNSLDSEQANDLSWVEGEGEEKTEIVEEPDEGEVESKTEDVDENEQRRREEQSFKDKFYAERQKNAEIAERLARVEALLVSGSSEKHKDDDGETIPEDSWAAEDPYVKKIASEHKELKTKLQEIEREKNLSSSKIVYNSIEEFVVSNKKELDNPKIGDAFIEELNDLLPEGGFERIIKGVKNGEYFSPEFISVLERKMNKAFKLATGVGIVNKQRQEKSNERAAKRGDTIPTGTQTKGNINPPPKKPLTPDEAYRACQGL